MLDLAAEGFDQGGRQEGGPVLAALAVADDDVHLVEIDILDPQPEALHQPEAGPVQQAGGEPGGAVELGQDGAGLLAAEDGRQPLGGLGPHGLALDPCQRLSQDDLVEEEQGAEGLVLGGGGQVLLDRQMGQEGDDFGLGHLEGMPLAMEQDESLRPVDVGVLGADAVMQSPGGLADLVQQLGHVGHRLPEIPSHSGGPLKKA